MATVDTVIDNHVTRANAFAAETLYFTNLLKDFIFERDSGLYLPGIRQADGTVVSGLDISGIDFPTYQAPPKDNTPFPVYEPPVSAAPKKPVLAGIANVTLPQPRTEPVINVSGLFKHVAPNPDMPDFTEEEPDLRIADLVAEMDEIAKPVFDVIEIPALTPLDIAATPDVSVPDYEEKPLPDGLPISANYANDYEAKYQQMLPVMQAFVDGRTQVYLDTYAPGYQSIRGKLEGIMANPNGVLPEQMESAMFIRARGRSERELDAVHDGLVKSYEKFGVVQPPGALMYGRFEARLKSAEALSNQSTDIYIEKTRIEVQFLGQIQGYVSDVRNSVIAYAGLSLNLVQQSMAFADSFNNWQSRVFEHLIARANFALALAQELRAAYDARLKAAISRLEVYSKQLEAEKAKKDVEIAQIQALETKVKVQALQVDRYKALIDAVNSKAQMEELKLKGYQIRADIFKNKISARLGQFDVFKAAMDGDKQKLEGELAKLSVFESLLKSDQLNLDAQLKAVDATVKANDGKIAIFDAESRSYELEAKLALDKFTAYSEVKKLHQSIYGQELTNAIKSFEADFSAKKALMEAIIEQYKLSVNTAIKEAEFNIEKMKLAERANEAAVSAMGSMASSSLSALNSVVTKALDAAA